MPKKLTMKRLSKKKLKPKQQQTAVGELRQDLITGKWVVVATGRAKRPDKFAGERAKPKSLPKYKDDCPFCNLADFPQEPDTLRLPDDPDEWQVHIFGNKFPALAPKDEFRSWQVGPYRAIESVGYHEVLATRWHNQTEAKMTLEELALELEALVLRYRQLKAKPSVNYIQIIRNHGIEAGASLPHPHHQIFTTPVLPSDILDRLQGAERFAKENNHEVFSAIIDFELERGERIVWQNDHFVVLCPFASRVSFEMWIMPKEPEPFFENVDVEQREALAEAMQQVTRRLYVGLKNPSYNYFIHSAPCDETGFVCDRETFKHFRWHIEILPRFGKWGGFELGTGLEITSALPEESAAFLRDVDISSRSVV